ncbi:hypothetical protein FA95DRAFT_1681862, partial [Auriscalpium vulgare]
MSPSPVVLPDGTIFEVHVNPQTGRFHVVCDICGLEIGLQERLLYHPIKTHRFSKSCTRAKNARERREATALNNRILAPMVPIPETASHSGPPRNTLAINTASTSASIQPTRAATAKLPQAVGFRHVQAGRSEPSSPAAAWSFSESADTSRAQSTAPSTISLHLIDPALRPLRTPSPQPFLIPYPTEVGEDAIPARIEHRSPLNVSDVDELCRSISDVEVQSPIEGVINLGTECTGVLVEWTAGSVWDSYPFQQHMERKYPWEPIGFENSQWLRLRACSCSLWASEVDLCCDECRRIPDSPVYRKFIARATSAKDNTPWAYLSHRQLMTLLVRNTGRYRKLVLKQRNMDRKLSTRHRKLNDHTRMTHLLANHQIPSLNRLLSVALRRGAGTKVIISRIQASIDKVYTPRGGYSSREMDTAFLTKALGGPRLLFAVSKSNGLPSVSTIKRNQVIPRLLPCVGIPTRLEIDTNISAFFSPEIKISPSPLYPSNMLPGVTMQFDGLAIDARCRYCSKRNAVLGLCRQHVVNVLTQVTDLASVQAIEKALHETPHEPGQAFCCYAQEATVAAIAPLARDDHYSPTPILVSPTCKMETAENLASWLAVLLDAWRNHEHGERLHGKIWSIASDGDALFRAARFMLCLNNETGKDGLIGTCDPKHVMKRFATLARNPQGVMINDTHITAQDILRNLRSLPGMTFIAARQLLDPTDKQNVPKAVKLFQELIKLVHIPATVLLPAEAHRRRMTGFFAKTVSYFNNAFITITLSLSEQVRSLATYAHLAAAMCIKHGTAFMTGALYADSQAIVKSIIYTILRLKDINENHCFFIIMEGTDRLENLFGDCRTQDHSRNFDILQLSEKLSVSALIQAIFERNPDLDRGHRRLSLKDAMGLDHINPKSWLGNVRVGDVAVEAEWLRGAEDANAVLVDYFGPSARVDFAVRFQGNCDLLRPSGHYVGVSQARDDDRTERREARTVLEADEDDAEDVPVNIRADSPGTDAAANNGLHMSTPSLPAQQIPSSTSVDLERVGSDNADADDADTATAAVESAAFDDMPEGLDLDDFLPNTTGEIDTGTIPENLTQYIEIEEKKYLKSSVVTSLLTSNRSRKVTMRTLRARGVTIEDLRKPEEWHMNDDGGENSVKSGDLVAVLVRVHGDICLAVLEILGFQRADEKASGRCLTAVDMEELEERKSAITVIAQITEMRHSPSACAWKWTHQYVRAELAKSSPHSEVRNTRKNFVLSVPGFLVHPLGPSIMLDGAAASDQPVTTWSLPIAQLEDVLQCAWDALSPETEDIIGNVEALPVVNTAELPYKTYSGDNALTVTEIPAHLSVEKPAGTDKVPCYLCGETMILSKMRNHVGHHIILALRQTPDPKALNVDVGLDPCGWCGRDAACITQMVKKGTSTVISSSCRYHNGVRRRHQIRQEPPVYKCA